jgi:hypothetical protein
MLFPIKNLLMQKWKYISCVDVQVSYILVKVVNSRMTNMEWKANWLYSSRSGQTKDYKIGICCFSTKHTALRCKSKDWLARNQNNVSSVATCLPTDSCFSELAL